MYQKLPKPTFFLLIGLLSLIFVLGIRCTPSSTSFSEAIEVEDEDEASDEYKNKKDKITAQNVDEYMYALRNQFLIDAVRMKFDLNNANPPNDWVEIPNKYLGGDDLMHAINPGDPHHRNPNDPNLHFNVVWYSSQAASVLEKVWGGDSTTVPHIDIDSFAYPQSTMIVQMVTVEDPIPHSVSWNIKVDPLGNTRNPRGKSAINFKEKKVWLRNIDMSYKDSTLGWVYLTFRYDSTNTINHGCTTCIGEYAGLDKFVAIGASWRSPDSIKTVFSPNSDSVLQQPFKGWKNQLTSYNNHSLSCVYCHSAAQWNDSIPLNNPQKLSQLFTGQIHGVIKGKEQFNRLFNLDTRNHAYCDNSHLVDSVTKSLLASICESPGPKWRSLDDDLLLTTTAAGVANPE